MFFPLQKCKSQVLKKNQSMRFLYSNIFLETLRDTQIKNPFVRVHYRGVYDCKVHQTKSFERKVSVGHLKNIFCLESFKRKHFLPISRMSTLISKVLKVKFYQVDLSKSHHLTTFHCDPKVLTTFILSIHTSLHTRDPKGCF